MENIRARDIVERENSRRVNTGNGDNRGDKISLEAITLVCGIQSDNYKKQ